MASKQIPGAHTKRRFVDTVEFSGHPLISALHATTIEVTKDARLTRRGDCVIGISALKSVADLLPEVQQALKSDGSEVTIRIVVSGQEFVFMGKGDARLTLNHPREIVLRKSNFVSDRTLVISATAAAKDIPRPMVDLLRRGERGLMEVWVRAA